MFQKIFYLSCLTLIMFLWSVSNGGSTPTGPVMSGNLAAIHGWGAWGQASQAASRNAGLAAVALTLGFILLGGIRIWSTRCAIRFGSVRYLLLFMAGGLTWLCGIFLIALATGQPVTASGPFANDVPNTENAIFVGSNGLCDACHGFNNSRHPVIDHPETLAFEIIGGSSNKSWREKAAAADVDSDGDGFTNGEELQDPNGTWPYDGLNNAFGDVTYLSNPSEPSSVPPVPQVTDLNGINSGQTIAGSLTAFPVIRYAGLSKVVYSFKNSNGVVVFEHTANSDSLTNYTSKFCLSDGISSTATTGACPAWNSSVLPDGIYSLTVTAFDRRAASLGGPKTGSLGRSNLKVDNTSGPSPTVFTDDKANNGNCTLREAIIAANTNTPVDQCLAGKSGRDIIQLQAGTYLLSLAGQDEDLTATGDLDITEDLIINGLGETTVIDGGGLDRVFDVRNDSKVSLSQLKIQKGGGGVFGGGGILNGGVLTLTQVIVFNNSGGQGGGIYNATGGLPDQMTIIASQIISNSGELGGGIHNTNGAALTMIDSRVDNNFATIDGGGIYHISGGQLSISNSTISGNRANGSGGGLDNEGPGPIVLNQSAVLINSAKGNGGGIRNTAFATTLTVTNSTISGNRADDAGGGLYNAIGTTHLNNVTIANNVADFDDLGQENGGGIYRMAGIVNLKNSLIATNSDNSPGVEDHPDCSGALTSQGYNLIGIGSGCTGPTNGLNGDKVGSSGIPLDPQLGALTDTPAYHPLLSNTSPAFNAGNPAAPGSGGNACAAGDQRGIIRPQSAQCDIGAIEFASATLTIGKTAPSLATAGQQITYLITVANIGDGPAGGVTVTDAIPSGATFIQALDGGTRKGNQVIWSVGNLAARSSAQVRFVVTADQTVVNSTYGATGNDGLTATGSPVTTTIADEGTSSHIVYLPLVVK